MDGIEYYGDGSARVLDILKNTFGDYFHAYFDGEAIPSESVLPCVMVTSSKAAITAGATGTDDIAEEIMIMVSLNRKDDLGASPDQDLTEYKIRHLVMGQDPTTQQFVTKSIMGALRTNFTLNDGLVIDNTIEIDFAPNVRGTIDNPINTMEAYITLRLSRLAIVPTRD
jgi:hypothetical protein